jgi:hypothetical protein
VREGRSVDFAHGDFAPFFGQNIFELYRRDAQAAEQRRKPQTVKTVWAIGSIEWLAEQKKSR